MFLSLRVLCPSSSQKTRPEKSGLNKFWIRHDIKHSVGIYRARGTGGTSKGYPAARIFIPLWDGSTGNKGVLTGEITSDRIWRKIERYAKLNIIYF